uniref:SMP-30/Gluconolactonase/LRE-like region domain-containing protein n=1 Tax=Guillardia theta TaxID=55529 RepID=A0A7S4UBJ8_GUITH|mmetsp:Transcript_49777/g.155767  ORF Transcript_49777/g.155767 Transcript_49777/m.155767 type:complete len:190 (+) Transcript_49777:455-1024(+)
MNKQWRDEKAPRGKLYVLDKDGKFRTVLTDVQLSNGMTWFRRPGSDAGYDTFYFIDSARQTVSRFDYDDKDGSIEVGSRKEVVKIPTAGDGGGVPDGMTIDADGLLWVTLGEGGAVAQYDAETGEEVQRFKLPVKRPTACTFGGEDLQELYITTREETGQEPSAAAGHLLVAKLDKSKGHAAAWRCKAI